MRTSQGPTRPPTRTHRQRPKSINSHRSLRKPTRNNKIKKHQGLAELTRNRWNPPGSTRTHQNIRRSATTHCNPSETTRIHQKLAGSTKTQQRVAVSSQSARLDHMGNLHPELYKASEQEEYVSKNSTTHSRNIPLRTERNIKKKSVYLTLPLKEKSHLSSVPLVSSLTSLCMNSQTKLRTLRHALITHDTTTVPCSLTKTIIIWKLCRTVHQFIADQNTKLPPEIRHKKQ